MTAQPFDKKDLNAQTCSAFHFPRALGNSEMEHDKIKEVTFVHNLGSNNIFQYAVKGALIEYFGSVRVEFLQRIQA